MESLAQRTFRNALWQVFNLGWVTLLNFFVTPILIAKIGLENYGVYVLILTILSFLFLIDFGAGAGFASSFIEYTVNQEKEKRGRLINSFLCFWLAVGLIGFLLLALLSFFVGPLFKIRPEFIHSTQLSFWFAGIYFALTTLSALFVSIAISLQRFDIVGKVTFIQNSLLNFLLVGFAFSRPSLSWLLVSHLIAGMVNLLGYFILLKRVFPELKFRLEFYPTEFFRKLRFSLFNFLNGLANNSLMQIDRFFISRILGNSALGVYVLSNNLAQKIYAVSNSAATTLFPVASDLSYRHELSSLRQSFRRTMRMGLIFSVLSGAVLMVFGYQLLLFWVGKEIADKSAVLLVYFVPTYILMSIYAILSSFYLGVGKARLLAVFSSLMALINIVLLVFLIPAFGLTGAALAFLLSLVPVFLFVFLFEKKELAMKDSFRFYFELGLKLFLVSLLLALLAKFSLLQLANDLWQTLLLMGISFAGIIGLGAILGLFREEEKELIKGFLRRRR